MEQGKLNVLAEAVWQENEEILTPVFPTLDAPVGCKEALGLDMPYQVSLRAIIARALESSGALLALQDLPVVRQDPLGRLLKLPPLTNGAAKPVVTAGPPFVTIVADPPWQYGNQAAKGAAGKHYATLPLDAIVGMPVAQIVTANAHLYLWTTNFFLASGAAGIVCKAWGFRPTTILTWTKTGRLGVGNYYRNSTEHILFAVRGKLRTNAPNNERTSFVSPWIAHSRKPEWAYELIARKSPGPYAELFARANPTPYSAGWVRWGTEAESPTPIAALDAYFAPKENTNAS